MEERKLDDRSASSSSSSSKIETRSRRDFGSEMRESFRACIREILSARISRIRLNVPGTFAGSSQTYPGEINLRLKSLSLSLSRFTPEEIQCV